MKQAPKISTVLILFQFLVVPATVAQVPWNIEIIKGETIGTEPGYGYGMDPINTPNYFQLGRVTIRLENGKGANMYKMLHYKSMKVSNLIVPMDNFPKEHMAALEMKQTWNGDILHYNGKVSTVKFDRRVNYKNTAEFVCQYDHTTGKWSELIKLSDMDELRFLYPMGIDRDDKYFYYAITHRANSTTRLGEPTKYNLARFDLNTRKIDTLLTLHMPKRGHYLHLDHTMISPDGRWFVLSEYGDRAWRKDHPKDAQPVAYIVDLKNRTFKKCRIPDTPYGHVISPDSKFMFLGSYETGEVVKIDLEKGVQVAKIVSTNTIYNFFMAPSGNYFLVDYDEERCPRKVYDVRSTTDLKLITSVLHNDLFSTPGMSRGLYACMDGRVIYSHTVNKKDSLKRPTDIYIHQLPETIKPNEPGSSTAKRLELAETIANGKIYAAKNTIEINPTHQDMGKATSVTISSDQKVLVTGSRSLDNAFTAEQVIAKLTRSGEKIWETKLKTVKDAYSSPGMHINTPDGGCIVYFMYYDKPNSFGIGRIAKIDGTGKVIYDTQFTYQPLANATYMTKGMELQNDGSVKVFGKIFPNANDDKTSSDWVGTVSPEGKLVKSEY